MAKLHTDCSCETFDKFIITGKLVLYFESSGKVKGTAVSGQLVDGYEFYLNRFG